MGNRWDRIGWQDMWDRFLKEWTDGCDTVRAHQLRVTCRYLYGTTQIMAYYEKHGERIIRERWPKKEEEK